jgi:uncharacterized protein
LFFDPKYLELLTPGFLHFKIAKVSHPKTQEGTIVDYRLKLHSVPLRWKFQITGWVPDKRFSDPQTREPYTFWHHTHELYESNEGTVISDNLDYKLLRIDAGNILAHA